MIYHHRFRVRAPLAEVAEFHRRAQSLAAITPPLVPMRFAGALPERLGEGDEMRFTLWLGPLPVRWHARIEAVGPGGFDDRQLAGPFAHWLHQHRFIADGDDATFVDDRIEARLGAGLWRRLIGLQMWVGLPLLFAWRAFATRRRLGS